MAIFAGLTKLHKFSYRTILRRCNETIIHLPTITIPLGASAENSRKLLRVTLDPGRDLHAPGAIRAL
ncbi:hypothetical protein DPMN_156228 [Dreissena polymorpha]|uniref:Uncharacterized protein n=1 Tax=Dreissena polymorpha TaxID=45954 RepID=A0A9D4J8L7_DREPO|nr:hypothetical protein DPMN_156228 [Dreissena polymorpha]